MADRSTFRMVVPLVPAGPSLARGLDTFVHQLGFSCDWQQEGIAGVSRGDVRLLLVESDDRHWAEMASFRFGVEDVAGLHEEYRSVEGDRGELEAKPWGGIEFHLILPSGVCLQFFETRPPG